MEKTTSAVQLWLRFIKCLLPRKQKRASKADWYLAEFIIQYHQVVDACAVIEKNYPIHAKDATHLYMNHVCKADYGAQWWQEHADYVCQAWFIWRYLCEHKLIQAPVLPEMSYHYLTLKPEQQLHDEELLLQLIRYAARPVEGSIFIRCVPSEEMDSLMRSLRCKRIPDGYVRKVDECAAPIEDRAVQMAISLLEAGYAITVQEKKLHEKILDGNYVPEHRHWIRATKNADWLQMVYPYDVPLHRYLMQMGGRWTGKQMLLHITAADRFHDVIRLYDFHLTEEADKMIGAWKEAAAQATIYRKRKSKNEPEPPSTLDRFHAMLNQSADVPEDLIDPND